MQIDALFSIIIINKIYVVDSSAIMGSLKMQMVLYSLHLGIFEVPEVITNIMNYSDNFIFWKLLAPIYLNGILVGIRQDAGHVLALPCFDSKNLVLIKTILVVVGSSQDDATIWQRILVILSWVSKKSPEGKSKF